MHPIDSSHWTDETTGTVPLLDLGTPGTYSPSLRQQPGERWKWIREEAEADKRIEPALDEPSREDSALQQGDSLSKLFDGDEDIAIMRLRERLAKGDLSVLLDLISAIALPPPDDEDGACAALALETIAGLRSTIFEGLVVSLVRIAVRSPLSDLRFAAVASAGELSREGRLEVLSVIRSLGTDPDSDIQAASKAFVDATIH